MSTLPVLLRRYKDVFRRYVEIEHELADLDRQILAANHTAPARRRRRSARQSDANDAMRTMLRVMREAKEALPPREIASRLGLRPDTTFRRLRRAIELGYVERTGSARYAVSNVVPSL